MASSAYPYGLVPVQNLSAGYNTQGFETLTIADGYSTAIYFGDVVKFTTDGTIVLDNGTTALTPIGVFVGCRYINSIGYAVDSQYWPGVTTGYTVFAKVVTDPNAVFAIQADAALALSSATTVPIGLSALAMNAALATYTAGSATFGKSKNALNGQSVSTTNTLPLRIVGLVEEPNNNWTDTYANLLVKWNAGHQYVSTTGV
jgi:hypothetical protein